MLSTRWYIYITSLLSKLRIYEGERETVIRAEVVDDFKNTAFSRYHRADAQMN